ncbi:MAG TPA: NAD(+)/NADH kinase [Gaiellaceae bacterium]|nr:NAD(+)/NADH kinase [Gaiellaceae bacterium]
MPVLGLIVNPVAGIGGRYALKGSDDATAIARALAAGASPVAPVRARRALRAVQPVQGLQVVAPAGAMGEEVAADADLSPARLSHAPAAPTTAADTRAAAAELADREVDLILFAGGDGTARDVVDVVGTRVPVLGVPCGVKMRSGVFGTTPENAGDAAARFLAQPGRYPVVDGEVLDAADAALESTLFAVARVPDVPGRLQHGKAARPFADDGALAALAEAIVEEMEPERTYLLGPGTTTGRIMAALGLVSTPLGVDAVRDGALVASDLDEEGLLRLLDGGPATLILGVIGGQGFLLGRGNQQLSARVVRKLGVDNVVIVAGPSKVAALDPPVLHVDLGEDEQDRLLDGYRRVRVAPGESIVMRVAS